MEFTAQQIADYLGGRIEGDPSARVKDFARIEEGRPETLTFLSNDKYEPFLYETLCSIALVKDDFVARETLPETLTLIRVPDSYAALAQLMQLAASFADPQPKNIDPLSLVHPTAKVGKDCYIGPYAIISEGVQIGDNCRIYPHTYIGRNCQIGNDCTLYPNVTLYHATEMGDRCIIHAGAVIGADGFGFAPTDGIYEKIPQLGRVRLASDIEVGANSCIDRAAIGTTEVGKGSKIDNLVQLGHNSSIGEHTVIAAQVGISGSCHVGSHCLLGGQSGISGHLTIGDNVSLGGQTGILGNVPAGSVWQGTPGMPARDFLRSAVISRKLPQLLERIEKLEKRLNDKEQDA